MADATGWSGWEVEECIKKYIRPVAPVTSLPITMDLIDELMNLLKRFLGTDF